MFTYNQNMQFSSANLMRFACRLILLSALAVLPACSTVELAVYGDQMTEDEKLIREQSFDFKLTNIVEGAIVVGTIGCAIGAVAISVAAQGGGELVAGCLALGALGAVAGGVDGYNNALLASSNAQKTSILIRQGDLLRTSNNEYRSRLKAAERVLAADRVRMSLLSKEVERKWYEIELARTERQRIISNNKTIRGIVEDVRAHIEDFREDPPNLTVGERLNANSIIRRLEEEVENLEKELVEFNVAMKMKNLT